MKKTILLAVLLLSVSAFAAENQSPEAQAIDKACEPDAITANCGPQKVGTGLLKCLHTYRRAHRNYRFSPSCKEAIQAANKGHQPPQAAQPAQAK